MNKKELFGLIGFFIASCVFVFSLVQAVLSLITYYIEDTVLGSSYGYYGSTEFILTQVLPTLILLIPIIFFGARIIRKRNFESKELKKVFLYIILLVVSVTIFFSLSTVISSYLSGTITLQSFIKILALIFIMLLVLAIVYGELKRDEMSTDIAKGFFISIILFSILVSIVGLIIVNPSTQRYKKIDQERVENISSIDSSLNGFHSAYNRLPVDLEELKSESKYTVIRDPETKNLYEYIVSGDSGESASICANFSTEYTYNERDLYSVYSHPMGRHCFEFKVKSKSN